MFCRQFVILGFASPSTGAFALIAAILVPVGTELGDVSNVIWIINAWSIAASISFTIAGKASDIFGRRWIYLSGVAFSVIGSVNKCLGAHPHTVPARRYSADS